MVSPVNGEEFVEPMQAKRGYKCVFSMARPPGFEPGTHGLEGRCSIQLSYGRNTLTTLRCGRQDRARSILVF